VNLTGATPPCLHGKTVAHRTSGCYGRHDTHPLFASGSFHDVWPETAKCIFRDGKVTHVSTRDVRE